MRKILYIFAFLSLSNLVFANEIKIIELHNKTIDQLLIESTQNVNADEASNSINQNNSEDEDLSSNSDNTLNETSAENIIVINNPDDIIELPDFWQNINKSDLVFLLDNINNPLSKNFKNELLFSLNLKSKPPKELESEEFNYILINNLIKMGDSKKAYDLMKSSLISEENQYLDFYKTFELNYLLATYKISEACEFRKAITNETQNNKNNFLLKFDIFCLLLKEKFDEADLINSLLLESQKTKDNYFQLLYDKLKNPDLEFNYKKNIELDQESIFLYSAMHRIGSIPLSENFLTTDPINLSVPIILSSSTNMELRLKAAHEAYKLGLIGIDSISALYQAVDFTYEELNNPSIHIKNIENKVEVGMAYFFQLSNIQLLPITRLEAVLSFWDFAEKNNLKMLSYQLSEKIIDSIDPSNELSDYGPKIARAYIYSNKFKLASKWLLFSETSNNSLEYNSVKLLFELFSATDDESFKLALLQSFQNIDFELNDPQDQNIIQKEILYIIESIINEDAPDFFVTKNKLVDNRLMPSTYVINKIKKEILNKNFAEFLLLVLVSIDNKNWNEIHPEHLKLILSGLKDYKANSLLNKIILEILDSSKII